MPMQAFTKSLHGNRTYSSLESILDNPTELLMASSSLQRPVGRELDILSAPRYPQGLMQPYDDMEQNPRKRTADSSRNQLYGGIVLAASASESKSSSSAERDLPSNQKKARSTKRALGSDGDDQALEKKQRGRPRLDTQDETAADRRRTQIRLAQRAYRHRKETTISALKQKVNDLQTTIGHMNKTFLTLHDNMVDAGILNSHYSLGRQLQSATEEFVTLSKIASPDSDEEEEAALAASIKDEGNDSPQAVDKSNNNQKGSAQQDRKSSLKKAARKPITRPNPGLSDQSPNDAEADVEDVHVLSKNDDALLVLSETGWATDTSNIHGLNDVLSFNATIPEMILYDDPTEKLVIETPLKPAYHPQGSYTYSFQETTFARRLHRMCLERAFRNLTNPNIEPDYIKRTFRFTFSFSNRKRMLQRFQEMLKRKAGESLENWNAPFFHIGGAGTHFPRRDEEGNPIYPPNMISPAKAFGPQPYVEVETPRMEASMQEMLDNIGFGGTWFDSHDVEQYLRTKGIYLDGQSSFIEVDPTVLAMIKSSTISTNSDGRTDISSDRSPLEAILRTPSPIVPADQSTDPITDPFIPPDLSEMYAQSSLLFPSSRSRIQTPKSFMHDDPWADLPFHPTDRTGTATRPMFSEFLGGANGKGHRTGNLLTFDVEMFLERMIQGVRVLVGRRGSGRRLLIRRWLRACRRVFEARTICIG